MGFLDVVRLYQQPSALDVDPETSRASFLRDVQRMYATGSDRAARAAEQDRYDFDRALDARAREARRTYRNLTPAETRYRPPKGQATEALRRAVERDAAIQQYDVSTPGLREAYRAGRP